MAEKLSEQIRARYEQIEGAFGLGFGSKEMRGWADAARALEAGVERLRGSLAHDRFCRVCAEDGCGQCNDCETEVLLVGHPEPPEQEG